ncbi:hypothetical protein EUGRSUZ_J02380 [Eucalyptus grandis]|uniref:Dehydrin n=2 Tax=Eucalyptus grandis TaxID=71139 RepID=A0A059AI61_EUCGR|nr:hypothetical protein EUGRSUZ_J02380 [Eucalyptus grandis]
MAHFQNHYASPAGSRTDEYGNPIRPADEYGNPVYPGTGHGVGAEHGKEHHTLGGMLRRSGSSSSSSSSSEDDGHGGRRKKGIKEKIKEKLPGRHDDTPSHTTASTTPTGYHATGEPHEKKGIMDKIKEKLPGSHHHH